MVSVPKFQNIKNKKDSEDEELTDSLRYSWLLWLSLIFSEYLLRQCFLLSLPISIVRWYVMLPFAASSVFSRFLPELCPWALFGALEPRQRPIAHITAT